MVEDTHLFIVFQAVWQSLRENRAYSSMKNHDEVIETLIKETNNNQKMARDFCLILENILFLSQRNIAHSCRDELVRNSTFVQYRGAKIYKPIENDKSIKILEQKIKSLEQKLKQVARKKNHYSVDKFIAELSKSHSQLLLFSPELNHQLFILAEHNCDVTSYKSKLREGENSLCKQMLNSFLIEIERNRQLNNIFDAETYLTINQIFNKFKSKPA